MAADWVAVRPIDHPLGSGTWAFQPGDPVPDGHVKEFGYDKVDAADGGPYVKRAEVETDDDDGEPGPAKQAAKKAAATAKP